jgi:hypothetical protein
VTAGAGEVAGKLSSTVGDTLSKVQGGLGQATQGVGETFTSVKGTFDQTTAGLTSSVSSALESAKASTAAATSAAADTFAATTAQVQGLVDGVTTQVTTTVTQVSDRDGGHRVGVCGCGGGERDGRVERVGMDCLSWGGGVVAMGQQMRCLSP